MNKFYVGEETCQLEGWVTICFQLQGYMPFHPSRLLEITGEYWRILEITREYLRLLEFLQNCTIGIGLFWSQYGMGGVLAIRLGVALTSAGRVCGWQWQIQSPPKK